MASEEINVYFPTFPASDTFIPLALYYTPRAARPDASPINSRICTPSASEMKRVIYRAATQYNIPHGAHTAGMFYRGITANIRHGRAGGFQISNVCIRTYIDRHESTSREAEEICIPSMAVVHVVRRHLRERFARC